MMHLSSSEDATLREAALQGMLELARAKLDETTGQKELCRYSGAKIYPRRGIRFVRSNSQVFLFVNSKCKRYFRNRLKPSKFCWTVVYRKQHKKVIIPHLFLYSCFYYDLIDRFSIDHEMLNILVFVLVSCYIYMTFRMKL
ncbi:hypothetical protein SOVF_013950 [Spinacia oleracea]|nr:hypothetical protein SOVF_013950 [Spinacia oleracea]